MPKIRLVRESAYTAAQMFSLVLDVDCYREFIPYCTASKIISREDYEAGEKLQADLSVRYKFLHETYRSEIIANADKSQIEVKQVQGPFRQLHNNWRFTDTENGCTIEFILEFEFGVKMLGKLIQPIMPRIVTKFINSFEDRAREIYL